MPLMSMISENRIVNAIGDYDLPMTVAQIAEATDMSNAGTRRALQRLEDARYIYRSALIARPACYCLTDYGVLLYQTFKDISKMEIPEI